MRAEDLVALYQPQGPLSSHKMGASLISNSGASVTLGDYGSNIMTAGNIMVLYVTHHQPFSGMALSYFKAIIE